MGVCSDVLGDGAEADTNSLVVCGGTRSSVICSGTGFSTGIFIVEEASVGSSFVVVASMMGAEAEATTKIGVSVAAVCNVPR